MVTFLKLKENRKKIGDKVIDLHDNKKMKFTEISKKMKLSRGRAHQIYWQAKQFEEKDKVNNFLNNLTGRTRNCLLNYGIETKEQFIKLSHQYPDFRMKNAGKLVYEELYKACGLKK